MRKNSKYYNNGLANMMIADGDPIPDGFVPGMVKRSPEDRERSNQKRKKTNLDKYGVEAPLQSAKIREQTRQTNLTRYGVENPSQSKEIQEKREQTFLRKFGTTSSFSSDVVKEKIAKTNLARYGVENPFASEEIQEKIRQTNFENLGVEYPTQSKEVREKVVKSYEDRYGVSNPLKSREVKSQVEQTNLDKYGVPWTCMRPEARMLSNDSKPNRDFAALLDANGIEFEREFRVGKYSYDFKIGSILVEIDPTWTHNTVRNPFGRDGLLPEYHQDKSRFAEQSGYKVIHVFDWDNLGRILNLIREKEVINLGECVVREIDFECGDSFLNEYHALGSAEGQEILYGLCRGDQIVSVMTFGRPEGGLDGQYELIRHCSIESIPGGSKRLFESFVQRYDPQFVVSYCDRSKFDGVELCDIGMTLISYGSPSCIWNIPNTDKCLRVKSGDEGAVLSERYLPVYDCGQDTYVWKNPT